MAERATGHILPVTHSFIVALWFHSISPIDFVVRLPFYMPTLRLYGHHWQQF